MEGTKKGDGWDVVLSMGRVQGWLNLENRQTLIEEKEKGGAL